MDSIAFRPARPDAVEELTNLALASKRHWGYSETLIQLWRDDLEFTPASIRAHTVTVAERAGHLLGVSAFSVSGATAELEGLWVHPSCLGQGLGAALFHELVGQARDRGAASLIIDSDPHAERGLGCILVRHLGASSGPVSRPAAEAPRR